MASDSPKTVLVIGGTGRQGGAVINSLLSSSQGTNFRVIAVTRDTKAARAKKLAARPGVSVIAGDLADPEAIFAKAGPVWGVYGVQANSDEEEEHGKSLIDSAVSHGVQHFVYSSSDRGGPEKSAVTPTDVKNFAAKYHIEKHLEAQAAESKQQMTYSILRPVSFFDNLTTDRHGLGYARMWEQVGRPLQMVATADIGWFAAHSFLHPVESDKWAPSIVGDCLSQPEADVIFQQIIHRPMPIAPCPVGSMLKFFLRDTIGDMFGWFKDVGFGGSIEECRKIHPEMQDFRQWVELHKGLWLKDEK